MMRNRWWAAISVLAMVGVWAAGSVAWAGSGQVVPGGPDPSNCDDPGTADVVETCDGRRPGDVSLEFAFMFPPTQADADDAVLALTRANRILCDATDGQVRIARVRWVVGDAAAETADIRWYYSSGLTTRSRASDVGQLGVIGQHVAIMTDEIKGEVVAHEFGHYLLGLYDSYAEDPKAIVTV
jgi:hypothetical protein